MNKKIGVNLQQLKEQNLVTALNIINRVGPISRIELGKTASLSPTTCTAITRFLLQEGIIHEIGIGESSGGRRPILLEIKNDCAYVIAVKISHIEIKAEIFDIKLKEVQNYTLNLENREHNVFEAVCECVDTLIKKSSVDRCKIVSLTIGVPGIVVTHKDNMIKSLNLKPIDSAGLYHSIKQHYEFNVYMENYGNLMALAVNEINYPEANSLACIIVDSGIGSGIVMDKKIVRGAYGCAGEIGHISVDANGPLCFCGNKGCLEVLASIPSIINRVEYSIKTGTRTSISAGDDGEITIGSIVDAFNEGDKYAQHVIDQEMNYLLQAVINIAVTYDPEVVVIGGAIMQIGNAFIDKINEKFNLTLFGKEVGKRVIAYNELEKGATLQGGGIYGIRKFYENPSVLYKTM